MAKSTLQSARLSQNVTGSVGRLDESYDLRGLNLSDPDQVTQEGESPKADNCRMYARQVDETRVAIRTRKGSTRLSTPVGETLNVQNVDTSTGDAEFTNALWLLEPFTPSSSGALTKLEFEIKRVGSGGGHVIVEIFEDVAGVPGDLVAQSSLSASLINTSFQYVAAYFMQAPALVNGTPYWHRVRVQANGTATYALNKTAASGGYSTPNPGTVFTSLGYTWRYKSYLSTVGEILGFARRYPVNLQNRTIFAMNQSVYSVTDAGVATSISSAINANATIVRFADVDDRTIWVDGYVPYWYDGTTVSVMMNVPANPVNVIIFKNRAFFYTRDDPNRVGWSELYSFESYRSVDFFYVPRPKSADHITAWVEFQDRLTIFTHETKHNVSGSTLGSFTRTQAVGTKGAVSQEAVAVARDYIYFMGDDKQIYRYNGIDDEWLSEKIAPALNAINDVSKVRLHIYNNQLRVYYPTSVNSDERDMLLLELSNEESNKYLQWFHDSGRGVCGSLEWTQDDNELVEFSSNVGAVYFGERGESDLGKAIEFKYWTKYKAYGSGMAKDRIKRYRPFLRPADSAYTLRVGKDVDFANDPVLSDYVVNPGGAIWDSFDWDDGTIWGDNTSFIDTKVPMSGRGKYTQFRFESEYIDAPVEIYGYGALIKSGRPR